MAINANTSMAAKEVLDLDQHDSELRDLLCRGIQGDQEAYARFLKELYEFLLPIVKKKSADAYDDITQEILISIHEARHTFDPARGVKPWILAIAFYRLSDERRSYWRLKRKKEELSRAVSMLGSSTVGTVNGDVVEAVKNLPRSQREIVTLMKVEGYSVREVAERLGVTISAVKNRASRAYDALRAVLSEDFT